VATAEFPELVAVLKTSALFVGVPALAGVFANRLKAGLQQNPAFQHSTELVRVRNWAVGADGGVGKSVAIDLTFCPL
jgi:hypothetical protein